jgi:hypothetical protein
MLTVMLGDIAITQCKMLVGLGMKERYVLWRQTCLASSLSLVGKEDPN